MKSLMAEKLSCDTQRNVLQDSLLIQYENMEIQHYKTQTHNLSLFTIILGPIISFSINKSNRKSLQVKKCLDHIILVIFFFFPASRNALSNSLFFHCF